jgi:CRP-like cAMP-binding protein
MVSAGTVVQLKAGETLVHAGSPAGTGWLVATGRMRLEAGTPSRSIGDVWPGEMVGEHGLFGPAAEHVCHVVAGMDSVVIALDRTTIQAPELRSNRAMAALQQHMLLVTARRLHTLDSSRARLQASQARTQHAKPEQAADRPDEKTLMGWLRGLFGGEA